VSTVEESNAPQSQDNPANHANDAPNSDALSNGFSLEIGDPSALRKNSNPGNNSNPAPWWKSINWQFVVEILVLLVGIRLAFIYSGQLTEMRKSTKATQDAAKAAQDAANTADATLKEIQRGGTDTHVLTLKQIDAADRNAKAAEHFAGAAKAQSDAMSQTLALQRELARLDHGGPTLAVNLIGMYHWDREKRVKINIMVQNDGTKTPARQIAIAAKMDVRRPHQGWTSDEFKNGFKRTTDPAPLPPFDQKHETRYSENVISGTFRSETYSGYKAKDAEIYIWGVMRHIEFGEVTSDRFCKHIPAKVAFSGQDGTGNPFANPPPPNCGED
jgi:hypothetical protein